MLFNKTTSFLTITLFILFSNSTEIFSAEQDNKAAKAFELFDVGNYADAEPLFKDLIEEKPELLMLYYYYGACRTENKNYSENDLIHLLNANPNEAPANVNYYLGIQYQALNNWEQALKYFNKFKLNSSSEVQTELNLAEKIQQCFNQENPYSEFVIQTETQIDTISDFIVSNELDTIPKIAEIEEIDTTILTEFTDNMSNTTNDTFEIPDVKESITEVIVEKEIQTGKSIEFRINSQITYFNTEHFQTEEGKSFFEKGESKQNELDSTLKSIEELRDEYLSAESNTKKNSVGEKILALENESYSFKEEITQLYFQSENRENIFWVDKTPEEIESFVREIKVSEAKREEKNLNKNQFPEPDVVTTINPEILFNNETVTQHEERSKTEELIYKIQIGAYSRGLPTYVDRLFKKLSLIRRIENYTDENGVVVYTTGNLSNMEDAIQMQKQVRQEGVEDAYVVPYFNGKRITLEQAKKIIEGL